MFTQGRRECTLADEPLLLLQDDAPGQEQERCELWMPAVLGVVSLHLRHEQLRWCQTWQRTLGQL